MSVEIARLTASGDRDSPRAKKGRNVVQEMARAPCRLQHFERGYARFVMRDRDDEEFRLQRSAASVESPAEIRWPNGDIG
jgi:hypothetical protein